MQKLNEWSSGKAGWVTQKVYALLTKYTGVKFKICPTLNAYKNKWGTFIGKIAFGSNGRFYRLNFLKGKTEQIVSMDVWNKGQETKKMRPAYTCSLEGWGIGKVIRYLTDFVKTPEASLSEEYTINDGYILHESLAEITTWSAEFLAQNPQWQQAWTQGNVDQNSSYPKEFKAWVKAQGRLWSGARPPTNNEIIRKTKEGISKGITTQVGIPSQTTQKMKQGAQKVPAVAVFSGVARGEDYPVDLSGILDEKVIFDQIQAELINDKDGPIAQMKKLDSAIRDLLTMGPYGKTMLVAWGRGGIGKTRTLKDTLENMGVTDYVMLPTDKTDATDGELQDWIVENKDASLIIINDADKFFTRSSLKNMWKQVLEHDPKYGRTISVPVKSSSGKSTSATEEIPLTAKFVWLSNMDPANAFCDASGALKSRYLSVKYNFTDIEVMAIILDKLKDLYPEFEDVVTLDDKARLFYIYLRASQKRSQQGILRTDVVTFRDFNDAIEYLWNAKIQGRTFESFVKEYLPANAYIQV